MTSSYSVSFTGHFGDTIYDNNTYTFPSNAQPWGGFAIEDDVKAPFGNTTIEEGNYITFDYSTDVNVSIRFKFENNPYPNNEPEFYVYS
jgi:hypothetical protein